MANLKRCHSKFTKTPVLGWNATTSAWVDTGLKGRLQVYDRFITERDFGQRKRILTIAGKPTLPAYNVVKLEGSDVAYLIESSVEDMSGTDVYATTLALHEAAFAVQVCKKTTVASQSGIKRVDGEQVLATTWVDITRYTAEVSAEFKATNFTVYTVYFPRGTPLDTDSYVRRIDNGEILDINEVFQALDIPAARCQRRG
jgi:hypothetical protein